MPHRVSTEQEGEGELTDLLSATTLRTPAVGNFRNAKSRCGSHRPVTAPGRNPPTLPARFRPNPIDLRRSVPLKIEISRAQSIRGGVLT